MDIFLVSEPHYGTTSLIINGEAKSQIRSKIAKKWSSYLGFTSHLNDEYK
jgi:DNA-dependent RNA polymerase auxiliary subunit epsilon